MLLKMIGPFLRSLYIVLVICVQRSLQELVQLPGCDTSFMANCTHGGPSQNNIGYFNNLMILDLGSRNVNNATRVDVAALVSTMYAPTVVVFETSPASASVSSRTDIKWNSLLNGQLGSNIAIPGVGVDGSVFGITFARLLEFNSTKNSDTLKYPDHCKSYNLSDPASFHWQQVRISKNAPDHVSVALQTTNSATNLTLLVDTWPVSDGRDSDLPRLQHTPGTLQLQLVSNNTRAKAASAFAVEFNVIAYMTNGNLPPASSDKLFSYGKSTILDDEQSPGVFSSALMRLASQSGADVKASDKHGFLMWKPVAYNDVVKNTESVLVAKTYSFNNTLPYAFFHIPSIADALVMKGVSGGKFYTTSFNLSFGQSGGSVAVGDQSYNTWTALIGVGEEKLDSVSAGVIMAILFGLGVPIVLLILVGGYIIIWKRRNRRRQPVIVDGVDNPVISGPYGSDL